ncbi:pre-mRNA-splicing regulator female-lethal(2)D [Musca vetustissima]|uniref:pre-mRNA-splicing regulator female-lethal(2)D n=1 Tax=Musca vetustissima TaxID=27455 RepID=UPI002AB60EEA|nr:pre-mRNA-splicing regulator female-lethal(2)D [Musca vetustissima]
MSVAAMTMDDQRPLMNSYDKMSSKYEQNLHNASSSSSSVVGGGNSVSGGGVGGGGNSGGLLSGPASPTPSVTEEPTSSAHHAGSSGHHHHHSAYSHHHHHQHHHHPHHVHHAVNQQQQQQQQQQSSRPSSPISTGVMHQDTVAAAAIIAAAEQRQRQLEDEIENLKLEQQRLTMQCTDAQRREKILMRRLANKEQEFQDYVSQIAEYKAAQAPSAVALRSALLDPAVNLLFQKLKKELKATKAKLEETQNELSAWKFTPDSNTGKRLMAKCRLLYQENEELGKMTSNGRLAKLETELSMQKSFSEEVKKSQSELDDFLQELDEDVEGMQSTILFLQQELKTTRDRIQVLEKENFQLKTGISTTTNQDQEQQQHGDVNAIKNEQDMSPAGAADDICDDDDGTAKLVNGNIYGNDVQMQQQQMSPEQMMYKQQQQQIPLETIDENVTMRPGQNTTTTTATYYNGNECDAAMSELIHEGNGGGAIGAKMRTVASRKRNYECDAPMESIQMQAMAQQQQQAPVSMVSSPRTLPPKKSKLRVVPPTRRSSIQSIDENEMLMNTSTTAAAVNSIVDNAMDGMANEESAACDPLANDASAMDQQQQSSGMAQRIMTRRRSVRLNGASNGGGGGDSNH